jgi:hypothetical protein
MSTDHRPRAGHALAAALAFVVALPAAAECQAREPPYTLEQIGTLVEGMVPAQRIRDIVGPRCAGFVWGPAAEDRLRAAGANANVMEAVRQACKLLPPPRITTRLQLDVARLVPHVATYRIRDRPDQITRHLARTVVDGHTRLRFITVRQGSTDSAYTETVADARSLAPVSYHVHLATAEDTATIELRAQDGWIERAGQRTGKGPGAVRFPASNETLLPAYQELLLMSATSLRAGQTLEFPTFTANHAMPCILTLRVEREREISVPAGRFRAWQVITGRPEDDVNASCGPAYRIFVSREPPHVILATEGGNYRVELAGIEIHPGG